MKTACSRRVCLGVLVAVAALAAPVYAQSAAAVGAEVTPRAPVAKAADRDRATAALSKLPIRFEPTDQEGTFHARGIGPAVRLTGRSIDFPMGSDSQRGAAIRVEFVGAGKSSRVSGVDPQPGRINYLYGDDPTKWRTNVPTYARAHTSNLYRGIDVDYYGSGGRLEYDFIVQRGARPDSIRLRISGASVSISGDGDLVYGDRVLLRKPAAYQVIADDRHNVSIDYCRHADGSFGFVVVGGYDRNHPLVIDPVVQYSFTFGGDGEERIAEIAVDDVGAVYTGGSTYSSDFPAVRSAEARQDAGALNCVVGDGYVTRCSDGLLAKLRSDGAALEYATYVGASGFDSIEHIAVGGDHAVYFAGNWVDGNLLNIPIRSGYFIGKLAPDGTRFLYKIITLGSAPGARPVWDLAAGADGSMYVLTYNGSSSEVDVLSPTGQNYHPIFTLPPSTGVLTTIASRGNSIFVAGYTYSPDFSVTPGAAQTQFGGSADGVLMRLNTDGTVVYSTFAGATSVDAIYLQDVTVRFGMMLVPSMIGDPAWQIAGPR